MNKIKSKFLKVKDSSKTRISKFFIAKDSREKLAKSLIIGCLLAVLVAFLTLSVTYERSGSKRYVITKHNYSELSSKYRGNFTRKNDFNGLLIIIGLIAGSAIGYLVVKEEE